MSIVQIVLKLYGRWRILVSMLCINSKGWSNCTISRACLEK